MKKHHFAFALITAGIIALIAFFTLGEKMKLTNNNNGFVVVKFNSFGKSEIYDLALKDRFIQEGIIIPEDDRDSFEGKEVVFLDDPLFQKAFIAYYKDLAFDNSVYIWEKY